MLAIYKKAKEKCGYNATRFLRMVTERGGLDAARQLVNADTPSDGCTFLWEHDRLDLSVEALVISPQFANLFTPEEVEKARKRLAEYGYAIGGTPQ